MLFVYGQEGGTRKENIFKYLHERLWLWNLHLRMFCSVGLILMLNWLHVKLWQDIWDAIPVLVTQMERNLSAHTVFFSVHGKRYFQRIWGTLILAKLGLYVARRESVCKPSWRSHSFFQGLRELSFPFQTLAPGLWLCLLKRMPEPRNLFIPCSRQGRSAQK